MSDLIALVTEVEADMHEQGWDFEPVVFVLADHPDDERGLHFEYLDLPTALFNEDLGATLEALALKGMRLSEKALGILIINEAWGMDLDVSDLNEDGTYNPETVADKERKEYRMATLLTRDGQMICGQRERTKDVFEVHVAEPEHVAMQMTARFPELMYILLHGKVYGDE